MMMRELPPLYILRHGQTLWNQQNRCQGHLDSPLSDLGRAQAAQQGQILRDSVLPNHQNLAIRVSPLGRTQATWRIAAEAAGINADLATPEPRLAEVHMGDWQGRLREEFLAEDASARARPNLFELSINSPGGEDFDALKARLEGFLSEITGPTICVTHGMASLVLRGLIRGLSRADMAGQSHDQGIIYGLWDGQEHRLEGKGHD